MIQEIVQVCTAIYNGWPASLAFVVEAAPAAVAGRVSEPPHPGKMVRPV